jgi:peroxiredoxin
MGEATKNGLKHGTIAPDFKNLPGVDGKNYSLSDFSSNKALVIFFSCNHCPYVQAYEDRIIALQTEFKDKGIQFIAINSNDDENYPDDNFDNMVKRAKEKKFNFLYLHDQTQNVAKAYQATHTPHIFVFNQKKELSYTGKIDDNWQNPTQVKRQFLREALSALAQGRDPAEAETFAIGCTIKWKQ